METIQWYPEILIFERIPTFLQSPRDQKGCAVSAWRLNPGVAVTWNAAIWKKCVFLFAKASGSKSAVLSPIGLLFTSPHFAEHNDQWWVYAWSWECLKSWDFTHCQAACTNICKIFAYCTVTSNMLCLCRSYWLTFKNTRKVRQHRVLLDSHWALNPSRNGVRRDLQFSRNPVQSGAVFRGSGSIWLNPVLAANRYISNVHLNTPTQHFSPSKNVLRRDPLGPKESGRFRRLQLCHRRKQNCWNDPTRPEKRNRIGVIRCHLEEIRAIDIDWGSFESVHPFCWSGQRERY